MNLFRKNNYLILILPPVFLIILGGSNIDIQNHCKIIIDFSDEGRTFMGIGATAETSVRLLMDYPENVLREILRIMFEQNFGASLQHLKLEIGSDANSSSGTIPSHMRSKEDNCISRVFLLKFAKMAKEINHNLILSALRWGTPSWIKSYEDKYLFYKNYLLGAREVFNLEFDYLGPDQNEGEFDREWVKFFRKKLNEDGFERIKFIAADAVSHPWYIVTLMNVDEELKKIINIVGVHYTLETPTKALYCGKPIWHSEAWPLMWSKSWKERPLGGLDFAKTIMETFVKAKMCAYIMNPFVEAYYPIVPYNTKSCLIANTPWSGHYEVTDGVWIVAHFTQFIKPGWKIIDSASKFSNPFYCMTACDSGYQNYSIVIVNPTQEQLIYEFLVEDKGVSGKAVHVWKSTENEKFVHIETITPKNGSFTVRVEPFSIYSLTTTTGQKKGHFEPPPPSHLMLPYFESFDEYKIGSQPKYFCDQGGAFEVCGNGFQGKGLRQVITRNIKSVDWVYRKTPDPYTIFGDIDWANYSVSCWVNLEGQNTNSEYVMLGGRVIDSPCNDSPPVGYYLKLYGDGSWELKRHTTTLIKGIVEDFDSIDWHHIKISFKNSEIRVFLDGSELCCYNDEEGGISSGLVVIGNGYHHAKFDELRVEVVDEETPVYVRKVDNTDPSIKYVGKWYHVSASYSDYRRTLSETPGDGVSFLEYTFEGKGIHVVGNVSNNRIKADVFIDGKKVKIIDMKGIENGQKKLLCRIVDLPPGKHVLKFVPYSTVKIDYLEILEKK